MIRTCLIVLRLTSSATIFLALGLIFIYILFPLSVPDILYELIFLALSIITCHIVYKYISSVEKNVVMGICFGAAIICLLFREVLKNALLAFITMEETNIALWAIFMYFIVICLAPFITSRMEKNNEKRAEDFETGEPL